MNPEREKYFIGRMQTLASLFEAFVAHRSPVLESIPMDELESMDPEKLDGLINEHDPELLRLKEAYMQAGMALADEFDPESEYGQHWNDLMDKSGARARIDLALSRCP